MNPSTARSLTEYLATLPPDRRKEFVAVRKMVKGSIPKGYAEVFRLGMVIWEIPLKTYPSTYNGHPLWYAALVAQKRHLSLYLFGAYSDPAEAAAIKGAFRAEGKRLDMGKSCIRFQRADDLPLKALARSIASIPPTKYIVRYEMLRKKRK